MRNVAVIGHLHHGKTTFVDMLVSQTHYFEPPKTGVQADLPGGALVALDCVALRRSGEAMARNDGLLRLRPAGEDGATTAADAAAASPTSAASLRRQVLHVQSISEWAPVCIGPYSQANVLNGLVLVAGQIALVPASMAMVTPASAAGLDIVVPPEAAIDDQLYVETVLSLRHCERILRCLQSRLAAVLERLRRGRRV